MKNVKATVSDFEGQYSAYSVSTSSGWAYKGKGPNYERAVDIGSDISYALTTADTQKLYGDTVALRVLNDLDGRTWPSHIRLYQSPVKLVSLALTFNKISQLMAQKNETGVDPVHQAFLKAAGAQGLQPLGEFFIIPASLLPKIKNGHEVVPDPTGDETILAISKKRGNIILTGTESPDLLANANDFMLFQETLKPGFIAANRKLHLVGLYLSNPEPVKSLPIPKQDRAPITQITSELRRILG